MPGAAEKRQRKNELLAQGLQECVGCSEVKPLADFTIDRRNKSGYGSRCRSCANGVSPRKVKQVQKQELLAEGLKHCPKCGTTKPVGDYRKHSRANDGLQSYCKQCMKKYKPTTGPRRDNWRMVNDGLKRCSNCSTVKPLSEFNNDKNNKTGYTSQCRECVKDAVAKKLGYRPRDMKEDQAQREQLLAQGLKVCPRCSETKPLDGFYSNASTKHGYSAFCKTCHRIYINKRRLKLNKVEYDPAVTRESLRDMYGDQCAYCGCVMNFNTSDYATNYDPKHVTLEHFVPISELGSHTFDNCFLACRFCNLSRNNYSITEFLELTPEDLELCRELAKHLDN